MIKQAVKKALESIPGNRWFNVMDVMTAMDVALETYKPSQISRALRDIPYVKRDGTGRYIIKGRRV